jgi:hypothetical protein
MPTLEHAALIDLFRDNPNLAPHFLQTLFHLTLPAYTAVSVAEPIADQLIPVEFRADLVLQLRDQSSKLVLSIVLELQRNKDSRKKYSWPVYVAVLRAKTECDTILLVVAPDAEVATWAAETIDLGLGQNNHKPLVLGPMIVPEVTDPAEAEREVELAVLSAAVHGNGRNGLEVVLVAFAALGRLDKEHATAYFWMFYKVLREPIRDALRAKIMELATQTGTEFPPLFQVFIDAGELKGELKGKRESLFNLLRRAKIDLTEDDRSRILACQDGAVLDGWISNVLNAKTAADVFS